jgi:hypothetical protein
MAEVKTCSPVALADPAAAPLGTTVVFPAVQDGHHPRDIAIRWAHAYDRDENPWLILGSDGPQRLSNEAVSGCEVLSVPLVEACRPTGEDSNLVTHARRELALIGEEQFIIDATVAVVRAFANLGYPEFAAEITTQRLEKLLRFRSLSPLTNDPSEWEDRSEISGYPMWQSNRSGEAFSEDAGKTYYLLYETGSDSVRKMHTSAPARAGEAHATTVD